MSSNPWKDKEVEAHWDSVADIYVKENDRVKATHDQRFIESIHHLKISSGHKILNITSRDGEAEKYIKKNCPAADVLHAEISNGLMEVAEKMNPGLKQLKIDNYSSLPFNDGQFDRILSLETLEHVSEPLRFLSELHRISKKNSIMVLSCPPATSEITYRIYSFLFGGHGEGPHRFPSSGKVKKWLEETGWKLKLHKGTILIPVGPVAMQKFGEKLIDRLQNTFVSELGIRQFYICERA